MNAQLQSIEIKRAPLGDDEIKATRENLEWSHGAFEIPQDIYKSWSAKDKGAAAEAEWNEKLAAYRKAHDARPRRS